ncbi:MAG TPA: ribosome biogenesis factor YjgA [Gammaproteobacteria bacterium]|nr:ribosome biogenesis factor YjgA [Gammaproteobacteria bacterium]
MTDDSSEPDSPKSLTKSALKRHMDALQKMGETLVHLSDTELRKIPLENPLLDAILTARSLKSHEAKRRQLQYIGKIMRNVDVEPIQLALEKVQNKSQAGKAQFHQIERWRDQLIAEGDVALEKFIEQYPDADRQHIRQLMRKAQQDVKKQKNTGGETELFRYVRELVEKTG